MEVIVGLDAGTTATKAGQRVWVVSKGSRERRMAPLSPRS